MSEPHDDNYADLAQYNVSQSQLTMILSEAVSFVLRNAQEEEILDNEQTPVDHHVHRANT